MSFSLVNSDKGEIIFNFSKVEIMTEQFHNAAIEYITQQILLEKDNPNKWVLFNGAVVKIVDTGWDCSGEKPRLLYPDYHNQGTVSDALYHIEQGTLMYFLTATY